MKPFSILLSLLFFLSCSSNHPLLKSILKDSAKPTSSEVNAGLKEALVKGISIGADLVSKTDGYFKNPQIKIPFPPEAQTIQNTLIQFGLGNLCEKVTLSLNRAAESAAGQAKDVFIDAIKKMTFQDAMNILMGHETEATQYLQKTTSETLRSKFSPIIQTHLNKVNATKYWREVMSAYNKIPLAEKIETDLPKYVTEKALHGLFYVVADQEKLIRKDPVQRTTDLLKRVFGYADQSK